MSKEIKKVGKAIVKIGDPKIIGEASYRSEFLPTVAELNLIEYALPVLYNQGQGFTVAMSTPTDQIKKTFIYNPDLYSLFPPMSIGVNINLSSGAGVNAYNSINANYIHARIYEDLVDDEFDILNTYNGPLFGLDTYQLLTPSLIKINNRPEISDYLSIECYKIEVKDNFEIPTQTRLDNCEYSSGGFAGKFSYSLKPYIGIGGIRDGYINREPYSAQLYLSDDPLERQQGIFKGFIDINIEVEDYPIVTLVNSTFPPYESCGLDHGQKEYKSIPVRLYLRTQCYYEVWYPENLAYTYYTNSIFNNHIIGNEINTDFKSYNSSINEFGELTIAYYSRTHQGVKLDSQWIVLSELYVRQKFDKNNNLIEEYHTFIPPEESPEFLSYRPEVNQTRFNEVLKMLGMPSPSYGVTNSLNEFNFNSFNLTGINFDIEDYYLISSYPLYVSDQSRYAMFYYDAYGLLVDPINKIIYFILADGSGYYVMDLRGKVDQIHFFGIINKNQIMIGSYNQPDPDTRFNSYNIIDFELIRTDIKPTKILFDFNKLNISFIPCQTHCMAKGGIVSKVY